VYILFFLQAVYMQASGLHKPEKWLGETIFSLIDFPGSVVYASIKNILSRQNIFYASN